MYPGVRSQSADSDSQQQKLDLLMDEKSIVSQLFEPDTIDVCTRQTWLHWVYCYIRQASCYIIIIIIIILNE